MYEGNVQRVLGCTVLNRGAVGGWHCDDLCTLNSISLILLCH